MATIDEIGTLVADEEGRKKIRALVLRLGIFIGLDFEAGKKGKRDVRWLRRGVIVFGQENLPVLIHGHSRVDLPTPDAAGHAGSNDSHFDTQSAPACCRGPAAEPGSFGGEGTANNRPDGSDCGLEPFRTVRNVGATGNRCSPYHSIHPSCMLHLTCVVCITRVHRMPSPADSLLSYLADLTGERPELVRAPHEKLPLYLRKRYGCYRARILGRDWVLAIETANEDATPAATYATHADMITGDLGKPTVLVLPGLQSRTRQKLIQLRVPFIVPERQTFLPLALVDLRERRNLQRTQATKRLTPAAQVVLLYHLERGNLDGWPLRRIALATGYSPIMLSKVRAELEATGLCHARKTGRTISLAFRFAGRELWDKALPWLATPLRTSQWARWDKPPAKALVAGMTALCRTTKIADDRVPTFCMAAPAVREAVEGRTIRIVAEPDEADVQIEAWSYDPRVLTDRDTADPLSVCLTLREVPDERVQEQLETLLKRISWS